MDFTKLTNLGQTIQVKGIRTPISHYDFDPAEVVVTIVVELQENYEKEKVPCLHIVEGGVTGYESFYIKKDSIKRLEGQEWTACMGTRGRRDVLAIPWTSMKQVYNFYNLWSLLDNVNQA
jgi:hypothetical protein